MTSESRGSVGAPGFSTKLRITILPVADLLIDVFAPTLIYLLLTWTDLPNSVRLSIGGFVVAAKGVARMPDLFVDPSQRRRFGIALLVALIAAASTVAVFERAGSEHWSIVVGAVVLGVGLTPLLVIGRRRDHLAVLVVVEIGISVVLTLISTSAFFILVRPAIYTAIAGAYVLATVPTADPFALRISRTVTAAGDSLRAKAFDESWRSSPRFQRTQRWMSASLGVTLLAESVLRVVIVYTQPSEAVLHASLLSQVPGILLFVVWFAGIKFVGKPIVAHEVDDQMRRMASV